MSRPTIRDVARRARVGIGTVSRVLNNSPQVSDGTRERVLKAIEELNFKPSVTARQLPRGAQLHNIGVITQPFFNYYSFVERLRGVQRGLAATDDNYELILYNVSSLENYDERLKVIARAAPVEGLLVIDLDLAEEYRAVLDRAGIAYVGINEFQDRDWPCIGCDNEAGGALATQYLIDLGHRHIAYLGDEFLDEYGFFTSSERYEGYRRALAAHDLPLRDDYVCLGPFGYDEARVRTAQLLHDAPLVTAIFVMSDLQALGCMAAIRDAGLRVPEDISVMGYDDLEISRHTRLTTVRQHLEAGGMHALEYLLALMRGERDAPLPQLPPLEIVARGTTRRIG